MDELEALTRELSTIPSHTDESTVGDVIESWLQSETDGEVSRDGAPNGGNIIARKGDCQDSLALIGHHDVVPPDASQVTTDGSYHIHTVDGRLYGRGTADMKGAVAAAMLAFRDAKPDADVTFASFVQEETGGAGVQYAIDQGFVPERAIIGEGSTGYSGGGITDVAIAHKGRRGSTVQTNGISAHASEVDAGENAIYTAIDVIDRLRATSVPTVELAEQLVEGSLTVTQISGGQAWNVIPDSCTITLDERTVPGDRIPLEEIVNEFDAELTIEQDLPPMRCTDDEFRQLVLDSATSIQTHEPSEIVKPHATDAGWLADAGTETIVCGPAEPGQAHTATESVSLTVLERCYHIYKTVADTI